MLRTLSRPKNQKNKEPKNGAKGDPILYCKLWESLVYCYVSIADYEYSIFNILTFFNFYLFWKENGIWCY